MDIIVYGATSFVGKLLVRYLLQQYGANGKVDERARDRPLSWGIAGRSGSRLSMLKETLGIRDSDLPHFEAEASDENALRNLCGQARVIVSTVGPYALHGETLVRVCAETGTDYLDLSGEVQWIQRMIERYDTQARINGARMVPCSGFDSIPSDLGVFFLQQQSKRHFGRYCQEVKMRVRRLKGSASGGTIASMLNVAAEAARDPKVRRTLANPYALCPRDHGLSARQAVVRAGYDEDCAQWQTPFIMAAINTRIVHRSHALLGAPWGKDFRYEEALLTGAGRDGAKRARRTALGLQLFGIAAGVAPLRWLLQRFLPKPGEGPSPRAQEEGSFELVFLGRTRAGDSLRVSVQGDRDPGYGATARMLGEAAVCLALEIDKDDHPAGFWTPATLFGPLLIKRLQENAGMIFKLEQAATGKHGSSEDEDDEDD